MSKSAMQLRRERTLLTITRCARELTQERGLDGFTMDQLAERAGVSRRTLFNYVPGKVDAVLGPEHEVEPDLLETFRAGGPTGRLLVDVKEIVRATVAADSPDPAEIDAIRRLLCSDPRLMTAVHERFVEKSRLLSEAITRREGRAIEPLTLRLLSAVVVTVCDAALDEALATPTRTFAECLDLAFDTTSSLFEPAHT
ncbi:TetR family transcriptional regulator [Aeromicrobium senzhongii]|uniref:TetR family transcriptional regulator n=1 Tax=Aeromicrobium senzhongii TaxID=2663859 RepID=A0ABX6STL8_9ACTN|nr:TetR family transcriptional regulator [Aeromicrobium senzhongii]QNL94483.1 TetR family transcriptional regulator [Aeromicrobium senzhongii]